MRGACTAAGTCTAAASARHASLPAVHVRATARGTRRLHQRCRRWPLVAAGEETGGKASQLPLLSPRRGRLGDHLERSRTQLVGWALAAVPACRAANQSPPVRGACSPQGCPTRHTPQHCAAQRRLLLPPPLQHLARAHKQQPPAPCSKLLLLLVPLPRYPQGNRPGARSPDAAAAPLPACAADPTPRLRSLPPTQGHTASPLMTTHTHPGCYQPRGRRGPLHSHTPAAACTPFADSSSPSSTTASVPAATLSAPAIGPGIPLPPPPDAGSPPRLPRPRAATGSARGARARQ